MRAKRFGFSSPSAFTSKAATAGTEVGFCPVIRLPSRTGCDANFQLLRTTPLFSKGAFHKKWNHIRKFDSALFDIGKRIHPKLVHNWRPVSTGGFDQIFDQQRARGHWIAGNPTSCHVRREERQVVAFRTNICDCVSCSQGSHCVRIIKDQRAVHRIRTR